MQVGFHAVSVAAAAFLCLSPAGRDTELRESQEPGAPTACAGAPIRPDRVVTGRLRSDRQGSYVLVPFEVPAGTTAVRVKYCFDQPPEPVAQQLRHTLDLGLYEPRAGGSGP